MGMYGRHLDSDGKLKVRNGTDVDCSVEPSLTKQAERDATDINKIIARFERTGMVEHLNRKEPFYGDVSDLVSYQEALNTVIKARDLFNGMDARIRERFNNDPASLIAFLEKEENLPEAISLGMAVERPVVAPEAPVTPVKG